MGEPSQAALLAWLKQRGAYVSPKLDLFGAGVGGDRTVRAAAAVDEGERLLLVPECATLTLPPGGGRDEAAAGSDGAPVAAAAAHLSSAHPGASPFMRTVLLLMAELARGEASPWAPYIASLPASTDCLLTWPASDRALLAGTSLEDKGRDAQSVFASDIAPMLAARPDLWPPAKAGYAEFQRAAEMVQTRAFHMKEENWVTGAVTEAVEQLYLIPAMDMLNHSTLPELRNTTLERISAPLTVEVEGVGTLSFDSFFTMKAERAIAAGEEVLHTYGDLSDAQLLQTYGFLESLPGPNPNDFALLPFSLLSDGARRTLGADAAAALAPALLARKRALLAAGGALQAAAPEATEFVATAGEPLGDELLTAAQARGGFWVLLMTEEEFEQLREEREAGAAEAAAAAAGASGSGASGSGASGSGGAAAARQRLSLGRELLGGDFGELVGSTILQACGLALKRYPSPPPSGPPGSHAASAARVVDGERAVLNAVKRAALMVMAEAARSGEGSDLEEGSEEEGSESGSDSESESEDGSGSEGAAAEAAAIAAALEAAAAAAAAAGGSGGRKRRAGLGFADGGGGKGEGQKKGKARGGKRAHYGALTGPSEEAVLESDDSDKVGYESDDGPHGERHPPPPGDAHRYETAADGRTREVHGCMVGPGEEEILASDDSDKVGYA
ncbi:hypothetical protein Rsub_07458 [Raphidocelis subcapitata]|uniref:SET domain-containing protein n=1 Tax=Raphidocelis subcapitata TaxID=307507 RepID=A0A2V0PCR2_9CHLO|nr:hypothetical protein Rsub_07458 [Raphidocelis subcapitata]|eukprot:GBF94957.1 hypothetical protein Rsub_07458 [Raphidocelis subcapitata]